MSYADTLIFMGLLEAVVILILILNHLVCRLLKQRISLQMRVSNLREGLYFMSRGCVDDPKKFAKSELEADDKRAEQERSKQ